MEHNKIHGITPQTIRKDIREAIRVRIDATEVEAKRLLELSRPEKEVVIDDVEKRMKQAAKNLDFEEAAQLRDLLFELKASL
jgi:excinuclease ABC subunit B